MIRRWLGGVLAALAWLLALPRPAATVGAGASYTGPYTFTALDEGGAPAPAGARATRTPRPTRTPRRGG